MHVQTISMPPYQAEDLLRQYRRALHNKADAEYQAAAAGYEAMAKGAKLLHLSNVIAAAPADAQGRPRLAVCRADRKQVCFEWNGGSTIVRYSPVGSPRMAATRAEMSRLNPAGRWLTGYALVPMVPPSAGRHDLRKHHVLWEVEQWADQRIRAQPDRDPYLLRHLRGDLYIVVAEWDLTDLERAIMTARRDA